MSQRVRFPFDVEKFPHVTAYLLARIGRSTRKRLMKLLYLADRIHLVRYGRPIVGGRYCALQQGPVLSPALDILEDMAFAKADTFVGTQVPAGFVARLEELVDVDTGRQIPEYFAKQEPDLDKLSESDREVLDEVIAKCGGLTADQLSQLTHQHAAYRKTPVPNEIDYALFFEDESEALPEQLEYLRETQSERDALEALHG